MKSAFFIPSNRDSTESVGSYMAELRFAKDQMNRDVPMVVSETNDGPHVSVNARALARAAKANPDLEFLHLTVDVQREYFTRLFEGENPKVAEQFFSKEKNYGTAMNKLFLATCSLQAQALHRRDSDTTLLSDHLESVTTGPPIEVELSHLGRTVGQVAPTGDTKVDDRELWVVGGSYFGEWNLDVKDFARRSFDIVHRLYEILGFDKEAVEEICAKAFQFDPVYEDIDEVTPITSVNDGLNPDAGNVAIYRLHELLPAVPGRNMLAADYFQFDIATVLGIPSLHHTRPVFHRYNSSRFDLEQKSVYWEGMARFADYFNFFGDLFNQGLQVESTSADPMPAEAVEQIIADIRARRARPGDERVYRIEQLAREILLPFDERYARIGRHLVSQADRIVAECDEDYRRYEDLLLRWPTLVERAKNIDLRALMGMT